MKRTRLAILLTVVVVLTLVLVACQPSEQPTTTVERMYAKAQELGFEGDLDEFLEIVSGKDGLSAYELAQQQGFVGTLEQWLDSLKGEDGLTPTISIGEDGYWYINGEKTDFVAKGEQGPQGEPGEDGNGIVSVEKISSDGLVDTYEITFTDGTKTTFTVTNGLAGQNGVSVTEVKIIEGELWIYFSNDTSINLGNIMGQAGEQGPQGEPGQDGNDWIVGSGEPQDSEGKDGDLYLDTTTAYIYQKIDGVWIFIDKLQHQETVTVQFDLAGGEMVESAIVNVTKGSYLQLPLPSRTGYTFLGWYVGEGVNAGQVTSVTPIMQDMTLVAHWQANNYTVAFDDAGDSLIGDVTVTYDQVYTLPTPTRTGYTFIGWFNGDNKVELNGVWKIENSTTLVAHWQANTYTVTFETGTEEEIEPMEVTFGELYILPSPERQYYTFEGWLEGGSAIELTGKWSIASDVTLVASWKEVEYAVAYNNVEDCCNANPANITISQLPYTLKDAGKNDHVFEGWYVDPDFTTRVTQIDQLNMTLYAKFTVATSGLQFSSDYNGVKVIGYNGTDSDIIIPSYHDGFVTSIGSSAFEGYSITSIIIPFGITSIEDSAFSDCSSLTNIEIPSSVTSIGYYAFGNCVSLTNIQIPSSVTDIGNSLFESCSSLLSIEIPLSVTSIGDRAFYCCRSLISVEIPSSVPSIGNFSFDGCHSLTSAEIPSSVTSIGDFAFGNCTNLTSVEIPSSVTSVGDYAFANCTNLTNIEIPSSVSSIGYGTFEGCSSLTIYCEEESQPMGWSTDWNSSNCHVVWGVSGVGTTADYDYVVVENGIYLIKWKGSDTIISVPLEIDGLAVLGFGAIFAGSNVVAVEIPSSVINIESRAFDDCSSLANIEIPSSVETIGENAFSNCTSLQSITFEEGSQLQVIESSAFLGCSALVSVELPSGVMSVGGSAFTDCNKLKSIVIPVSVENIGFFAFMGCGDLTIYCEAEEQPVGWDANWNLDNRPVVWGVKMSAMEKVAADKQALTLEESYIEDFELLSVGLYGTTITWEVIEGSAIVIEGSTAIVTRGETDATVRLLATIKLGEATASKEFTVKVLANGKTTVVAQLKYTAETTTNMTGENDAALLNLDASIFTVVGAKGNKDLFPGLNKSGEIRMYGANGVGNEISVTCTGTISKILITFTASEGAKIMVGDSEVTANDDGTYTINANSFKIVNVNSGSTQVKFTSIDITYVIGG